MKNVVFLTILVLLSFPAIAADSQYYPVYATTGAGVNPNVEVTFDDFENSSPGNYFEYRCHIYPVGYPGWVQTTPTGGVDKPNSCLYQGYLSENSFYVMEIELIYYPGANSETSLAITQKFILSTGSDETSVSPAKVLY